MCLHSFSIQKCDSILFKIVNRGSAASISEKRCANSKRRKLPPPRAPWRSAFIWNDLMFWRNTEISSQTFRSTRLHFAVFFICVGYIADGMCMWNQTIASIKFKFNLNSLKNNITGDRLLKKNTHTLEDFSKYSDPQKIWIFKSGVFAFLIFFHQFFSSQF